MNKNRFEEHELPYQTLEKYGLTREMIEESLAYLDKKDGLYDENTKKRCVMDLCHKRTFF